MQKVEGSSPFSRSHESPANRRVFVFSRREQAVARPALPSRAERRSRMRSTKSRSGNKCATGHAGIHNTPASCFGALAELDGRRKRFDAPSAVPMRDAAPVGFSPFAEARGMASNSSSWMVKTIQTARIHGVGAAEGGGAPATEGAGAVAEGQMTILERADRASASLDARNRAEMAIRSSRRVTTRTTD